MRPLPIFVLTPPPPMATLPKKPTPPENVETKDGDPKARKPRPKPNDV